MIWLNKPNSGSLLLCFVKVTIIKIVKFKNVVTNQFGRVDAYLFSPYWCVYSAQCGVRLCVQCIVQSEIVCTVHSAVRDYVYNAQCSERLCVQCTVQSEIVCTLHCAVSDCV
jgi:hypothetical protein